MKLEGRTALVTGAGRGLGAAMAEELAAAGTHVILSGRDPAALKAVAARILTRTGTVPATVHLDLAAGAPPKDIAARFPAIDILINNGARWLPGRLAENTEAEIAETFASQLTGTVLLTRALLPVLKRQPRADIVNIVSISGLPNVPLQGASPAFHAAKHGQAGFSDGLRQELIGTPVRVTAIHPPNIDDIQPGSGEWDKVPGLPKASRVTNRDIVEIAIFALTRPRHVNLANIMVDADTGGLHGG